MRIGLRSVSRILFRKLEVDFPDVPKIVLSGAAFGTDLIAADIALQCNFGVAAVLPFERVLFEEDFRPPGDDASFDQAWQNRYAEHARTFEQILADPRVLARELPALVVEGGSVATPDQLSHDGRQYDKTLRRNHYEQVGQYIAEVATIMIAVISSNEDAEISEANGGTARIVAYRRAGRPDAAGTEVARRSGVLRNEWPRVTAPPAGFVWLIDPNDAKYSNRQAGFASDYPVRVLPPLSDRLVAEVYGGSPGKDMPRERRSPAYSMQWLNEWVGGIAVGLGVRDRAASAEARRLRASLILVQGLEYYHRAVVASTNNLPDSARPTDVLALYRSNVTARQRTVNEHVRWAFSWLSRLFVLAVFIFEVFEKFFNDIKTNWGIHVGLLGSYLIILGLVGLIAWRARWKHWSDIAEGYRTIGEMLRVQRAWWSAGLTKRVDREHLQGVYRDLARIRDCVKTIISYTLLRQGWKDSAPMLDWAHVRDSSTQPRDLRGQKKSPEDWIGSQLWYFVNKSGERERQLNENNALSWCLFITSCMLALYLFAWNVFPSVMAFFDHAAHIRQASFWAADHSLDASFVVWAVLAIIMIYFRYRKHDISEGSEAMIWTFVLGSLAAFFLFLALANAEPVIAYLIGWLGPAPEMGVTLAREQVTSSAAQVMLIVLTAYAGARRYRAERLNVEGEALEYRDAHERFERAERLLAPGSDPVTGAPADQEDARRLVDELGCLALAENEAWLKSRRERPLTPVVG